MSDTKNPEEQPAEAPAETTSDDKKENSPPKTNIFSMFGGPKEKKAEKPEDEEDEKKDKKEGEVRRAASFLPHGRCVVLTLHV